MNKSLTWGNSDNKYGFASFPSQKYLNQNFSDSPADSLASMDMAVFNQPCTEAIFSNETPVEQIVTTSSVSDNAGVPIVSMELKSSKDLTEPPKQKEDYTIINAVLIGLAAVLAVKILS